MTKLEFRRTHLVAEKSRFGIEEFSSKLGTIFSHRPRRAGIRSVTAQLCYIYKENSLSSYTEHKQYNWTLKRSKSGSKFIHEQFPL